MKTGIFKLIRKKIASASRGLTPVPLTSLFVIGDSISVHYGPYLETYLIGRIECRKKNDARAALVNLDVPLGANWGDSSMILERLRKSSMCRTLDADLALVNCGLHDIKRNVMGGGCQVPLALYRQNMDAIVKLFAQSKTRLIWVNTTPVDNARHKALMKEFVRYDEDCISYNLAAQEIMHRGGVPIIDHYGFIKRLGADIYSDHVHFIESVREKQAAYIAGWLTGWLSANG